MLQVRLRARLCALALFAAFMSGCCGHYVGVTLEITREVENLDVPAPEVVRSHQYPEKLPGLKKASIFFLQSDTSLTGGREYVDLPEIRELERSFVKGGFDVLEVRQISKVQLEKDLEQKEIASAGSDFIVIVYSIKPRAADLSTIKARGDIVFYYGCEPSALGPLSAAQIDESIGREGAMKALYGQATQERDQALEKANTDLPIAFLEAKLIETSTREVLVFYKAFTLLDDERPDGPEEERIDLGNFVYRDGRFQPHVPKTEKQKPDPYAETSKSKVHEGDSARLSQKDLKRIQVACDALVEAVRQPK